MRAWRLLIGGAVLVVSATLSAGVAGASGPQGCSFVYPQSRFVIEDGGLDSAGHAVRFCSEYLRHGGAEELGMPISRPFRVDGQLYQAFEYGVLQWHADTASADLLDTLDVLHNAGRDAELQRLGVPAGQAASGAWLTDSSLRKAYLSAVSGLFGLPTSAPANLGSFVVQRFQRGLIRRWVSPVPYDLSGSLSRTEGDGSWVERLMAGQLMRSSGLIPAAALVADLGLDQQLYNWQGAPEAPASLWSTGPVAIGGWDTVFHQMGAFDIGTTGPDASVLDSQVQEATALGLTVAINSYIGRDSDAIHSAVDRNLSIIDTYPWGRIEAACGESVQQQTCTLSANQLATLEQEIRHHLVITREDDSVVGYWVLDDYPGDVRNAIELVHRLVAEEAVMDREARPTICGFGGDLDDARRARSDSRAAFERAVWNFTVAGCDAVALYPYAHGRGVGDEANIDWSMSDLLPSMLARLRQAGWDPTMQPLIGVPQAFRFGQTDGPTPADVTAQAAAYCAAGASSIVFYAWNDSQPEPKAELYDAADLREGASQGMAACRAAWRAPAS
jgi:hypothetical protein